MNEPDYTIKDLQSESLSRKEYFRKNNKKVKAKRKRILEYYSPDLIITQEVISRLYKKH